MRDAFLVGISTLPFGRYLDVSFRELAGRAVDSLVEDSGLGVQVMGEVESAWFGNCFLGTHGQNNVRGQMVLVELMDAGVLPQRMPVTNVEAACATGSFTVHGAAREVMCGHVDVSLALAVEKVVLPNAGVDDTARQRMFAQFDGATDQLTYERFLGSYTRAAAEIGQEFAPAPDRSLFMDTYALQALAHMHRYGTTVAQIAAGAAKNHTYGSENPFAQYRFPMTPQQVLDDRLVSAPLTRAMCAPISDGAAAALVVSGDWLAGQDAAIRERAVRIKGFAASGGTYRRGSGEPTLSYEAARKAYAVADITPGDIDVAEVHDATSFGEILQVEMLGLCEQGQGGPFVADGATGPGGIVPTNTSGGLVSKGHPVGVTGLSMINELVVQLRGEAAERQVEGARIAVAENGGGVLGLEEAVCAVTVLERPSY
ncbi:thiolase family protein [Rhodococcus sp. ABRD24]|uniref:thiolase family protein n=1 Tax=Rhodococcus sp. ABRD24 TaxID=2507582 RepID=UPI0010390F50|nr:thiolase family protein [Rhodococcus sp. ABRD24]QBJ97322.1 thiolase family protein [Rhodococcus sp. ABRD24]